MHASFGIKKMSLNFSIKGSDGDARAGYLKTKHGSIKTPVFMPVGTSASVKAVFPKDLLDLEIEIIFVEYYDKTNSFYKYEKIYLLNNLYDQFNNHSSKFRFN